MVWYNVNLIMYNRHAKVQPVHLEWCNIQSDPCPVRSVHNGMIHCIDFASQFWGDALVCLAGQFLNSTTSGGTCFNQPVHLRQYKLLPGQSIHLCSQFIWNNSKVSPASSCGVVECSVRPVHMGVYNFLSGRPI